MFVSSLALWSALTSAAAALPRFERIEIDQDMCMVAVYAVALADVDADQRTDIIAVTENRVLWYRNPDWSRHVIVEDQTERDNVCIAATDVDGDGLVDFALGAGWLNGRNLGTIQWLRRGKSLDDKWSVHPIGAIPWTHRMRWGDVLGRGGPQLIVAPLNASEGQAGVELSAFEIPQNPATDAWPRTVLNSSLNRLHNIWVVESAAGTGVLTASQEGINWLVRDGDDWKATSLGGGAVGAKPDEQGAGEVKPGRMRDGRRFLAAIEPMHGRMAAVHWLPAGDRYAEGPRQLLDETLVQGHAVWPADFDGDGNDDVAVGFREPGSGPVRGPGVLLFDAAEAVGAPWTKQVLDDGGMATEDLVGGDLDGDGRIDLVAGGRSTRNLVLYFNRGSD